MSSSAIDVAVPTALSVSVTDETLSVELSDGRSLAVPLAWFPRLLHATPKERAGCRLVGGGEGLRWEALDEDISVESLLAGRASGESQSSLAKWLATRHR